MTDWWWAYLALGAFIGFLAGLLGIGGGFTMVPILAMVFSTLGFPSDHVLHLALGTGMATILFTSASSVRSHHRHGAVNWHVVKSMAPGVVLGTFAGALAVGHLDVKKLTVLFTLFVYYAATRMLLDHKPAPTSTLPGRGGMWLAGGVIGASSSFAAIGGAVLTVPFLVKRNITMHHAIASAAAIGWPLALAGAIGFIVSGYGKPGLPAHSIGYVYLPALVWIAIASTLLAPAGAAVAHRTSGARLRKIFAVLLYALATKMLWSFF
ncbi:MAG TPA: sulfite exporter TauE/SafE family protein [Burkholderiales bacterium]